MKILKNVFIYSVLIIILFVTLIPIIWMLLTSIKTRTEAFAIPPIWLFKPTFENFLSIFQKSRFGFYFTNSIFVAMGSTLVTVFTGSLAGYSLARFRFGRKEDIAFWILSTRMMPLVVVIIPIYILWGTVGLLDTRTGLILAHTGMNLPLAIWLLRNFIEEIPEELEESAMIDGCSKLKAFFIIVLPNIAPGLAATFILCFIFSWNEFMLALVLSSVNARTLPVSATSFLGSRGIMWGDMCAMGTVIILPIIILTLIVQKHLVKGLTFGAIK